MNIHYRIVKVEPAAHGMVVRYFTDKVSEMDLANSFNEDGSIQTNADGYPLSTRTDVFMSVYETPTPSSEELEKKIIINAPVDWLKLQEDIKDPSVDTKMVIARDMTGDSKTFTTEDIHTIRGDILVTAASAAKAAMSPEKIEEDRLQKAYDTVITLMDSLKVLAEKDPTLIKEFMNDLDKMKPPEK
jgi:hypothetical protein